MTAAFIDVDALVAMQFQVDVNVILTQHGVAPLRGRYAMAEARDALVAGETAESFAHRYASRALSHCTCGDQYREHGDITHACLAMRSGLHPTRCRCKRFVARVAI